MQRTKTFTYLSAAGLLLAALADNAGAQTIINGGGASAGRQLLGSAPASNTFCLASPTPRSYRNNAVVLTTDPEGNTVQDFSGITQVTWVCNVSYSIPALGITLTNQPVEIRYHSLESGDGFTRLTGQYSTPTTVTVIDASNTTCGTSVSIASNSRQVAYTAFPTCTTTTATADYGASDVRSTSFGQQGPAGTFFPPGGVPIDVSNIADEPAAVLPFGLFVSQHVRKRNADGSVGPAVDTLTRRQIRAILQRQVRDWADLGYGVTLDATHTAFDPDSSITLCRRDAGSGTLAALWNTLSVETPSANNAVNGNSVGTVAGRVLYNSSSSTLASICFNETTVGHSRRSFGYLNAETVLSRPHTRIKIEGFDANLPNDASYVVPVGGDRDFERKTNVACGRYDYWSEWRITRKITNEGTAINNLVRALADNIKNNVELAIPSGSFWPRLADMKVSKSAGDATPFNWNLVGGSVADSPECTR